MRAMRCPQPLDVDAMSMVAARRGKERESMRDPRALWSHLAPGGRIAIIAPLKDAPGGGPPDEFRFTPEEVRTSSSSACGKRSGRLQRA